MSSITMNPFCHAPQQVTSAAPSASGTRIPRRLASLISLYSRNALQRTNLPSFARNPRLGRYRFMKSPFLLSQGSGIRMTSLVPVCLNTLAPGSASNLASSEGMSCETSSSSSGKNSTLIEMFSLLKQPHIHQTSILSSSTLCRQVSLDPFWHHGVMANVNGGRDSR